ncbi:MAG: Uncharacterized protein XD94_1580 [Mesotoga prima]|uniref:Uncharacterized protein n=1 Tax=Mesotoga prima TaxID=1184387 RepID=A0A101HL99_9BACT|nr:MAG: Uncharacterized protein XD94_1580 [Mesotoga prima]
MSIDSIRSQNKGFVLPVALILMAFSVTTLFAVGLMVQRTSNRLNSYSLLSDLRVTTNNLVEAATMVLASKWRTAEFDSSWDGYDEFKGFVSSRGGFEGTLWAELLSSLGNNENWWLLNNDSDFAAILGDAAFNDYSSKGAVVNLTDGKYSIVSWAKKGDVKRYSYGLATTESMTGKAALIFGETDRVFHEITTYIPNQGGPNATETIQGFGDLINGSATVVGTVTVSATDINLEQVFQYGLEANNVVPAYDDYNYTKTASDADLVFASILDQHLEWLDSLTRVATLTFPSPTLPVISEDHLIPVEPMDASAKDFTISFPTVNEIGPDDAGYFDLSYKDSKGEVFTIRIHEAEYQINLIIYGNLKVGNKTSDALKLSSVNGKYSITVVNGDIQINTHLIYGDFYVNLDEALKQGGVAMNQPIMTWSKVKELLGDFANRTDDDYLSLKTIGGDINVTYLIGNNGKATHGVRTVSGDLAAFPSGGSGGGFYFPELNDVVGVNNSTGHRAGQLFVFGSITARDFGTESQLSNIDNFFVSSPRSTMVEDTDMKRLVLIGLRAW